MTIIQAIILGIIQGLTEFLPVSSSAHLVLAPHFLGWELPADQVFIFDVLVQIGTLIAVIAYFWTDLLKIFQAVLSGLFKRQPFATQEARLGWYLMLATIPAGLFGILVKDQVEAAFHSFLATALFLLVTAAFLVIGERFGQRSRSMQHLTWVDALVIGLFQAVSIFPGVSRSGSTITGGLLRHLDRPTAARFSFLMSVPVMLAAGLFSLLDLAAVPNLGAFLPALAAGFITSAIVGYFSIKWLLGYLARRSFYAFAIYVTVLSALTLLTLL